MIRNPAVAGQFYPGEAGSLRQSVQQFLSGDVAPEPAIGIISPHAGYVYSGAIAGRTFARVAVPRRVVVLGPNHQGFGHPAAVFPEGSWRTPLGETAVDAELAAAILRTCPLLAADTAAHRYEHSLEVQLPFIQEREPQAAIVPICLGSASLKDLLTMGEGLAQALAARGEVLMVASTDMTHYESGTSAREKDLLALEHILALDPEGLFRTVRDERISMCGAVPVTVMLAAARHLGATAASLVHYGNSGDVTGDQRQVVGYAGVVVR